MSQTVWIVGKNIDTDVGVWDFMGAFDSEAAAVAACTSPDFFVGPTEMNKRCPDERMDWPGGYLPHEMA